MFSSLSPLPFRAALAAFSILGLSFAGCAEIARMQAPVASHTLHEDKPVRPASSSLVVYESPDEVPDGYVPFASLASQGMVSDTAEVSVLRALQAEARSIGADAVAITQNGPIPFYTSRPSPFPNQPFEYYWEERYRAEATAYFFPDSAVTNSDYFGEPEE